MAKQVISSSDSGSQAAGKINDNFTELYGGSNTPSGIISLNEDAVGRIAAAKMHFINSGHSAGDANKPSCFCLAHSSDYHTDKARYERFRDFVDGVDLIDAAIVTGDITDKGTSTEMNGMSAVEFERVTPMQVIGNHERQGGLDIAQIVSAMGMADGAYYYKDFSSGVGSTKIRIIVLNAYDTSSTTLNVAQATGHYSQTQIDWFLDALDDAADKGYHVMVAMHSVEIANRADMYPTGGIDKGFAQRNYRERDIITSPLSGFIIEDIIAAFKAKSTVNETYTYTDGVDSVTVNHTFSKAGTFIAYIVGHLHADMTGYYAQHNNQLYLVCPASCVKGGENMLNPDATPRFYGGSAHDIPHIIGTKSEDCFNVYGVDTANKIIKVVRIGGDMNDLMEKREVAYFSY